MLWKPQLNTGLDEPHGSFNPVGWTNARLKVAEHSFLVPRYFQPTCSWAAKIGKMHVQLKKIKF